MAFSKWIIMIALAFSGVAFANEGGGEAPPAEGPKKGDKDPSASLPEWVGIQSKLQALRAKITAKDRSVRELIKLKQTERDPVKNREAVQNLKIEHKELRQSIEDYDKQLSLLRYRFPEKGVKEEERYKRVDPKSLAEMEKQVGMEGRLKQVSSKVRRQYDVPEPAPEAPKKKETLENYSPSITEPPVLSK